MIQDKIFFDEKDPTGVSYNTPFTVYGSYEGRLWSKTPSGTIKYYTQNSDLSVYATTGSNSFNGNQTVTGSLTVTGGITGSATTASYVEYTSVANKPSLVSSSAQIVGYNVFATTGSNQFNGSQAVTGSLTVTGQVVAQTLNVQQVTSSIVYSSGSNIFGNSVSNTQQFTGSVSVTGSLTVNGAGTFSSAVTSNSFISDGTANEGVIRIERDTVSTNTVIGALNFTNNNGSTVYGRVRGGRNSAGDGYASLGTGVGDNLYAIEGGSVGIGTASPETLSNNTTLQIDGTNHSFVRTGNSSYGGYFATIPTAEVLCIANVRNPVTGTYNNTGKAASGINLFSESSNGYITFLTTATNNSGPSERMRITSGGNVGIGITNPTAQLSLKNQISNGSTPVSSYAATNGVDGQNFFNGYYAVNSDGLGPYPRYFDIVSTGSPDGSNGGSNIRFFTNPITNNSPAVERMRITSGGVVRITSFTTNGLVGTDSSGNLGVVISEYTEIATGTITYSMNSGSPWAINNSFPATIRNYEDDGMAGSGGVDTNLNLGRGVTFDLGSAKTVRKIVERGYPTKNLNQIIVQYSTDNSNWTDIYVYNHVYGNTQKDMEFNPTGAISARYWRWFIHSWSEREVQNYYTYESIIYT